MNTFFDLPCPECGRRMSANTSGDFDCAGCGRAYHARMGHLFRAGERRVDPSSTPVTSPGSAAPSAVPRSSVSSA